MDGKDLTDEQMDAILNSVRSDDELKSTEDASEFDTRGEITTKQENDNLDSILNQMRKK